MALERAQHLLPPRAVVAVLRAATAEHFLAASTELWSCGFRHFEFTLTSERALDAVTAMREAHPEATVGVGTVRTVTHLRDAKAAGASFAVSQVCQPAIVEAAREIDLPFTPGALTPTEIVTAWDLGVPLVKVSPIGPLGGLRYLQELRGPLPEIALMPTGGVTLQDAARYLDAGAAAVGVSGDLFLESLHSGDLSGLRERANHLAPLLTTGVESCEQ